jgi:hypothetical protein
MKFAFDAYQSLAATQAHYQWPLDYSGTSDSATPIRALRSPHRTASLPCASQLSQLYSFDSYQP